MWCRAHHRDFTTICQEGTYNFSNCHVSYPLTNVTIAHTVTLNNDHVVRLSVGYYLVHYHSIILNLTKFGNQNTITTKFTINITMYNITYVPISNPFSITMEQASTPHTHYVLLKLKEVIPYTIAITVALYLDHIGSWM